MELLEIGSRFESYDELISRLNAYCKETKSRFWKRDARTIEASRLGTILRPVPINPVLRYYEVKFICIYSGTGFKSRGIIRQRQQ